MSFGNSVLGVGQTVHRNTVYTINRAKERIAGKQKQQKKTTPDNKVCNPRLNGDVISLFSNKLWRESKKNINFKNALSSFIKKNKSSEPRIYEEWKKQIMYKLKCWGKNPADKTSEIGPFVRKFAESSVKIFNNIAIHFDLNDSNTPCKTLSIFEKLGEALSEGNFVNKNGLKLPRFNETKLEPIMKSLREMPKVELLSGKKEFTTKEITFGNDKKRTKREINFDASKTLEKDNFLESYYDSRNKEIGNLISDNPKGVFEVQDMIYNPEGLEINYNQDIAAENIQSVLASHISNFKYTYGIGLMCGWILWIITLLIVYRKKLCKGRHRPVLPPVGYTAVEAENGLDQNSDNRN